MTYWKLGCNWGKGKPNFYDLLKKKSIVICAEHDMQIGDIVAVTSGYTVIALAEIIADKCSVTTVPELESDFSSYEIDYEDWNYIAKCKLYELDASNRFQYPLQQGICQIQKKEIIKSIEIFFMEKQAEQLREDCVRILKNNHNLILTGAPGTGKTYLAKQIAQQMIFEGVKEKMSPEEEKQFNEQCGFVQFHPSYDYTDFVEGLRPKNDNGNVGFERKDGVFKEFCSRALKNSFENTIDNFEETWNRLVTELSEKDYLEVSLLSGKNKFLIELNEYGDGLANRTYENDKYEKGNWIRGQSKFFSKEQCYNIYKGLPGIPSGGHDNYRKAIVNYMKSEMGLCEYKEGNMSIDNGKNYVFIIDEINRGEISKIFGELFFAIDPGYRGSEKCSDLRTQYANLQRSRNAFDEVLKITDVDNYGHFFVPENVYIIGTMNDIDRSVESMDFAFRRRFAFKEVTATESQKMLDSGKAWKGENPNEEVIKEIKIRMDKLNKIIWHKIEENEKEDDKSIEGLSSAYHIGASYFLKLANYKNDDGSYDFDKLWEYHLEGLLLEYLRGTTDVYKKLKRLAIAYGYSKANKYE